jgi:hypothetical protein
MTRTLPPHITPTAVLAAAEVLFRSDATKLVHDEARRRKIHPNDRQAWIEHYIAVRVYELGLRLEVGGCDDYAI